MLQKLPQGFFPNKILVGVTEYHASSWATLCNLPVAVSIQIAALMILSVKESSNTDNRYEII